MSIFYGITTLILTVMTISASPATPDEPPVVQEIQEQKQEMILSASENSSKTRTNRRRIIKNKRNAQGPMKWKMRIFCMQ